MKTPAPILAVCFDWGGTLMSENGPEDIPMGLWPEVEIIAGARECLESLRGFAPLAIATNATVSRQPMIRLALERVGLLAYFQEIFCFTEIGYKKNQPEFWLAVQARLGVPLPSIAMVGDSLVHDVLYPARFGVRSVWFNERGQHPEPEEPVPTVTDLEQFAALIKNTAACPFHRADGSA